MRWFILLMMIFVMQTFAQCNDIQPQFNLSDTSLCGAGTYNISITDASTHNLGGGNNVFHYWRLNGVDWDTTVVGAAPTDQSLTSIGTYTITLLAVDSSNGCKDSLTKNIIIHPIPNAAFTFNNNNSCPGTTISFNNTSTNAVGYTTYAWDFGDGTTSTDPNPTHEYNAGGSFNVQLIMNNGTCADTVTNTVTQMDIPNFSISADDGTGDAMNCLSPIDPTTQEVVTFTNNTTGTTSHFWDFGDGMTSTQEDPLHTYTSYGNFEVVYTGTHANGCAYNDTIYVVFERTVSAALSAPIGEYSGCVPHDVNPSNLSQNATFFTWNFGDGTVVNTSNQTAPSHSYNQTGSYTITLNAANSCGAATATISTFVVVDKPQLDIGIPFAGNGCAPQTVQFTNNSNGVVPANNVDWDLGNGNTYNNTFNPPVQTYNVGTYPIMLIGRNACGADTIVDTLVVDSIPTAMINLNIAGQDTVCTGTSVLIDNNSTGVNMNTQWFLDGNLVGNNNTLNGINFTATNGNASETHTVMARVSNHCGFSTSSLDIEVHPDVIAQMQISEDSICSGESVIYTQSSLGTNLSYDWDLVTSTSTADGPINQTYNNEDTIVARLITTGTCGIDTTYDSLFVYEFPIIDILPDRLDGCEDLSVYFTNNSRGVTQSAWNFGGNTSVSTSNAFQPDTVVFPNAGSERIYYQASRYLCNTTDSVDLTVFPSPAVLFTINDNSGCHPHSTLINNLSPNTMGNTYAWDFDNGNTSNTYAPGVQNFVAANNDSAYSVKLVITSANGCMDSLSQNITVFQKPSVQFSLSSDTICENMPAQFTNTSIGVDTYIWSYGNGANSSAFQNDYTYATPGDYTIRLEGISNNNCRDTLERNIRVDAVPSAGFTTNDVCFGDSVTFINTSSGAMTTFEWDYGDGNTSTNFQENHYYTSSGTYSVKLKVFNVDGCLDSLVQNVTVYETPQANFTWSDTCAQSNTQFTSTSIGTNLNYVWDFGDATNSLVANPGHTYATDNTFNVQLIVSTPALCADTITQVVRIYPIPSANFNSTPTCNLDSLPFTNASVGADSYLWDFGDGNSSTLINPKHSYVLGGTYTVSLIATITATGCNDTHTENATAFIRSIPGFTVDSVCSGDSSRFINTSLNAVAAQTWRFGDGNSSNTQQPNYLYNNFGTYSVTLINTTNNGCIDSITQNAKVHQLPLANFASDTVCEGAITSFTSTSLRSQAYSWAFGDGLGLGTSTNENPSFLYGSDGNYVVTLSVTDSNMCVHDTSINAVVKDVPVAHFGASIACFGYPTQFSDSSQQAINWNWEFEMGNNSTIQHPQYTYMTPGNYPVTLIVENNQNCFDTTTINILVETQPNSSFTASSECARDAVTFTDNTVSPVITWEWDFGYMGNTSNQQSPTFTYPVGGDYTVQLITQLANGCRDTILDTIQVFTNPTPNFSVDTVCLGTASNFINNTVDSVLLQSFSWNFGDGNLSTSINPMYTYSLAGDYMVELTATNVNGCDSSFVAPVHIQDNPDAQFTSNTIQGCTPLMINFIDQSTANPTDTYLWDFGDGTSSNTSGDQMHSFMVGANDTLFDVNLVITDFFGCSDTADLVINVFENSDAYFTSADTICRNESITFLNASVNAVDFDWDFAGMDSADVQNPTYAFDTTGMINVSLTVTSNTGCISTYQKTIFVYDNPVAAFVLDSVCEGFPQNWQNLSTGTNLTYAWDFGDGNTDNTQNGAHTYAGPGNYNVTLSVTGTGNCMVDTSGWVQVYPMPQVQFTVSNTCDRDSTIFQDNTPNNMQSWSWDFGDGNTAIGQNVTNQFAVSDTFSVNLIVSSLDGCINNHREEVIIYERPRVQFTPDTTCMGTTTNFVDMSTDMYGIQSWFWDFRDGNTSLLQNPNYIFNTTGDHEVILQVTNINNCSAVDTHTVHVNGLPNPSFTSDTVCFGNATTFVNTTTGPISASTFLFGDGTSSVGSNVTHNYANPGVFQATLIVEANGCTNQIIQSVQVTDALSSYIVAPDSICLGVNFQLDDTSMINNANIVNYAWDLGDGTTSNQANLTHSYSSSGLYTLNLTQTANNGCMGMASKNIWVHDLPIVNFNTNMTCMNEPVQFNDLSPNLVAWNWDFNDLAAGSNLSHPIHTYANLGGYEVSLTGTDAFGCSNTFRDSLMIYPMPQAAFTSSLNCYYDTTQFFNISTLSAGMVVSYQWDFDGMGSSTDINPSFVFTDYDDSFDVTLVVTTAEGCRDTLTQVVQSHPIVQFNAGAMDYTICENEPAVFYNNSTIAAPSTIVDQLWDFGNQYVSGDTAPTFAYDTAGNYNISLTLTTSDNCIYTDVFNVPITVYDNPYAGFNVSPGEVGILHPLVEIEDLSINGQSYFYDMGDSSFINLAEPTHEYGDTGTFLIKQIVTDQNGCIDSAFKRLRVRDEHYAFVPNSFTPNDNGINDVFYWVFEGNQRFYGVIKDRWGREVFSTHDPKEYWNGRLKNEGEMLKNDIYVYRVELTDINGTDRVYKGLIYLVR